MSILVRLVVDNYHDLMDNKSDPRVNNWMLMSSPFPTLMICLFYAYFVKRLGPKLMENRKPFELKTPLIIYNLFQVIFSAWLFNEVPSPLRRLAIFIIIFVFASVALYNSIEIIPKNVWRKIILWIESIFPFVMSCMAGWLTTYSFRCQPVDYSASPMAMRMANGCWWYYISKFTEFMDTLFFVLRKKNDHISTLHVIHHGVMPMSVWFGVKFTPGGHSSFFGFLNTFVHIIMYSYYLVAALGPQYQKYLWWKKYLTTIQMIQFVAVMVHAFQLLFIDCSYPKAFVWWIGMHAVMFYFLFSKFYKQTYNRKERARKLKAGNEAQTNGDVKKSNGIGICFPIQSDLYDSPDSNTIKKSYTSSDNELRNRAFVDRK